MRWLVFLAACAVSGQVFQINPISPQQGDTIHIRVSNATTARMNGRIVYLYPESGNVSLGLMPIPALEPPGKYKLELLDASGMIQRTAMITVRDALFPEQNLILAKELTQLSPSAGESEESQKFRDTVTPVRYWKEPLQAPVPGCLASLYGVQRLHNGNPTGDFHSGLDMAGAMGEPIHAAADGTVILVRDWDLHGNTVGIDHGQGLLTMYLHMSAFNTEEGAKVKKGDVIGYVGMTGRATGPHLHWNVYVNGVPVNPAQWVPVKTCYPMAMHRVPAKAAAVKKKRKQ